MSDINRAMLLIKSLDVDAHLEFSEWTDQWYVSARIQTGGDGLLTGITEHRATPEAAVYAFVDRLRSVGIGGDMVLITHSNDAVRRRHYKWNGAAFVEQPREAVSS